MKNQPKLSKYGKRYILRMYFQLAIQIAIIMIVAGTYLVGLQLWLYFVVITLCYTVELRILASLNPEVLNERVRNIKSGTKSWDKVLLSLYVLCTFVGMNIVIGLDWRYCWPHFNFNFFYLGLVFYIYSAVISTKSLLENKYFESSSRIQEERGQTVISTGVYSVVRHPGYSSILIWAVSMPMLTGAIYTIIPSIVIIIIISMRTYLEDTMLKRELVGYRDYTRKVRYRLIPYIW